MGRDPGGTIKVLWLPMDGWVGRWIAGWMGWTVGVWVEEGGVDGNIYGMGN